MTLSPRTSAATALLLGLALASCGGSNDKGAGQGAGDGEILEGSVSDDMLPYDTVRSQPPLAAPEPVEGTGRKSGATDSARAAEDAASDAQGAGETAAQPDTVRDEKPASPAATPPASGE